MTVPGTNIKTMKTGKRYIVGKLERFLEKIRKQNFRNI